MQVRSFAKENASCDRYGVSQMQVLRWGLKSAHASGARPARRTALAPIHLERRLACFALSVNRSVMPMYCRTPSACPSWCPALGGGS